VTVPSKRLIIDEIQNYLAAELKSLVDASGGSAEQATQNPRVAEIHRQLLMLRFLPVREFTPEDVVVPGGLVELDFKGTRALYFLVPTGGGLVMQVAGRAVQVITPQSPLGEVLLGRKQGDEIQVPVGSGTRNYTIVGYY
jgi:transcription elongation GreA/GreB family factor